jgi:hypothetical protein
LQITFLVSRDYISDKHLTLSEKEIAQMNMLAENNNLMLQNWQIIIIL